MKNKILILFRLAALVFPSVSKSQMIKKATGVEQSWCEDILRKVEKVAGCKCSEPITVAVDEYSGFMFMGMPVFGLYEQDISKVTVIRQSLSPWLLAHEFAHVVYCDNYSFHPEFWADTTADMAVGKQPKWIKELAK